MNFSFVQLLPGLLASILTAVAAENAAPRYTFSAGTTNGYRLSVESPSENTPIQYDGTIFVSTRSADEKTATVSFRAQW